MKKPLLILIFACLVAAAAWLLHKDLTVEEKKIYQQAKEVYDESRR